MQSIILSPVFNWKIVRFDKVVKIPTKFNIVEYIEYIIQLV